MQNNSRNMRAELEQGLRDNTYMQLQPDWSINANPPVDRLSWPNYRQVLQHMEAADYVIDPLTPREPAPPGGVYHVRKPGPDTSGTLLGDVNAS